jgi:hypothetical protein
LQLIGKPSTLCACLAILFAASIAMCAEPGMSRSANDVMKITSIHLSENPLHAGDDVTGTVTTSLNIASVTAQAGTFRIELPKVAPGRFRTTVQVPRLAFWDWKGFVTITAIRTDGAQIQSLVPIEVQW